MSCSRPAVWTSSWSSTLEPDLVGDRLGVARDGGRVARRHLVAQRQRLDERREDADLQRRELRRARLELLRPLLGQQHLAGQHLEDEQDDDERRQRGEPDGAVHAG